MEKLPRIPSKSEKYARVLCRGQQRKLIAHQQELDKHLQTECRSLRTHRNRFVLDRRRSMATFYNSQADGSFAHKKTYRRQGNPDSSNPDPEVVDILRKQDDRRKSIKAAEEAVNRDTLRMLQEKHRKAIDSGTGDDENTETDDGGDVGDDKDDKKRASLPVSLRANIKDTPPTAAAVKANTFRTSRAGRQVHRTRRTNSSPRNQLAPDIDRDGIPARGSARMELVTVSVQEPLENQNERSPRLRNTGSQRMPSMHQAGQSALSVRASRTLRDLALARSKQGLQPKSPDPGYVSKQTLSVRHVDTIDGDRTAKPDNVDRDKSKTNYPVQRKRSHSDGNIVFNLLDLQNKGVHPFYLAQEEALESRAYSSLREDETEGARNIFPEGLSLRLTERKGEFINDVKELSRNGADVIDSEVIKSQSKVRHHVMFKDLESSTSAVSTGVIHQKPRGEHEQKVLSQSDRHGSTPPDPTLRRPLGVVVDRAASNERPSMAVSPGHSDVIGVTSPEAQQTAQPRDKSSKQYPSSLNYRDKTSLTSNDKPQSIYVKPQFAPDEPDARSPLPRKRGLFLRSKSDAADLSSLLTFRADPKTYTYLQEELLHADEKLSILHAHGSQFPDPGIPEDIIRSSRFPLGGARGKEFHKREADNVWGSLMFTLTLSQEEKEAVARHKRHELLTSLRRRQQEVDGDVSLRIKTFLERYSDM